MTSTSTFIRSRRGQSRRADFYVCDTCGAVIHGRAGTMHLGVLSHLRMHKRRGEKPPPRSERDRPEDRQLVRKAGCLAICGIEAIRSLNQARAVFGRADMYAFNSKAAEPGGKG